MNFNWAKIKKYAETHERHVSIGSVLFGFLFDSLTLGRPDQLFNNVVFVAYLSVSAMAIILLSVYHRRRLTAPSYILPIMQFSFGNLAGGMFVVYGQSGTFEGSALFFLMLLVFIIGNELARNYYARLSFHVSTWFFLLFAYLSIIVPIFLGRVGTIVFLTSGLISLAVVAGLLWLLKKISEERVVLARKQNIFFISGIFLVFNFLYFANIIPPVPLSLTNIGIYHSIRKNSDGTYSARYEKPKWYEFGKNTSATFTVLKGNSAYCFSSVFAPTGLRTGIRHRFEKYDESSKKWKTKSLIPFPILGGRGNGYRGYTIESNMTAGKWRCGVETSYGAVIGRNTFNVVISNNKIGLQDIDL